MEVANAASRQERATSRRPSGRCSSKVRLSRAGGKLPHHRHRDRKAAPCENVLWKFPNMHAEMRPAHDRVNVGTMLFVTHGGGQCSLQTAEY